MSVDYFDLLKISDNDLLMDYFDTEHCASFAEGFVCDDLLAIEDRLIDTAWFDYRPLHPWLRTAIFAEEYKQAYASAMKMRVEKQSAKYRTGLKKMPLHEQNKVTLTGLYKSRQLCDAYGFEYFDFCLRTLLMGEKHGCQSLPRPQHLYNDKYEDGISGLLKKNRDTFRFSKLPLFYKKNFCDLKVQKDHILFLVAQILLRPNKGQRLAECVSLNLLAINQVAKFFKQDDLDDALSIISTKAEFNYV